MSARQPNRAPFPSSPLSPLRPTPTPLLPAAPNSSPAAPLPPAPAPRSLIQPELGSDVESGPFRSFQGRAVELLGPGRSRSRGPSPASTRGGSVRSVNASSSRQRPSISKPFEPLPLQ
eukprot:3279360-Rhodomonas_salina.1